jgi:hypothetical protein
MITSHGSIKTNHILHLLISILTVGIWVPVWVWVSYRDSQTPSICSICGTVILEARGLNQFGPG